MRGLGISAAELAGKTELSEAAINSVLDEEFDPHAVSQLAPLLGLHGPSLVDLGERQWKPGEQDVDGVEIFNTPYPGMTVNAYLIWNFETDDAVIFDTGTDVSQILELVEQRALKVRAIFLTHTHRDHIMDLDRLKVALPEVTVYVGRKEPVAGASLVDDGDRLLFGGLAIEARLTSGHSVGGITYIVEGLQRPVAVVGDALFAGSMGGGMISWREALENNRSKVFTLPNDAVVCPGHGPMTSIGEEKAHNPCYPEFKKP